MMDHESHLTLVYLQGDRAWSIIFLPCTSKGNVSFGLAVIDFRNSALENGLPCSLLNDRPCRPSSQRGPPPWSATHWRCTHYSDTRQAQVDIGLCVLYNIKPYLLDMGVCDKEYKKNTRNIKIKRETWRHCGS